MGKFFIECPKCGSMNMASTSLFSKKVVKCNCGNEIDVKASRGITKICSDCGTAVVCDQAKLKNGVRCPKCGNTIGSSEATAEYKMIPIHCPQCDCLVEVDKTQEMAFCPICDEKIDVRKQIAKENIVKNNSISIIKYEGDNSTFIWKHPAEDFNWGSQLIVHENQNAILFYNGKAIGTYGAGRYNIETQNVPFVKGLINLPTDNRSTPFHAEVYFINLSVQMGIKWGTPDRVRFLDPESGMPLDIGASGELNLRVDEERVLEVATKLVGTMKGIDWNGDGAGFTKSIKSSFRAAIVTEVTTHIATVIKEENISIFEIDSQLKKLSEAIGAKVKTKFNDYGLIINEFYVTRIALPEDNPNFIKYRELKSAQFLGVQEELVKMKIAEAQQGRRVVEAQTEAKEKTIGAAAEADATRLQGFAEAEVMRAKGYTEKDRIDAEVQKAYAAGMGQFGANAGAGGGGGVASDMMNMMMGMKMFETMSGKMDGAFSGMSGASAAPVASAAAPAATGWNCSCGESNIQSKFCPQCGKPKPEAPAAGDTWVCECGAKGNKGKFCAECGKPKPEAWDCSCGAKGIKSKFCPECGKAKE